MLKPNLTEIKTADDLIKWPWLKTELMQVAKNLHLGYSGTKEELVKRICEKLSKR